MDDNETLWKKLKKLRNLNMDDIKNSWLLLDPEQYLKKQININPVFPFKKATENGIYILTSCIFWDTYRNVCFLIGLLVFTAIRTYFRVTKGLDDYIMVSILCSFYLIIRLIWCMNGRTLIIDHNCHLYEYYRGKKLIYRGHLHNIFVRLKGVGAAEGQTYFKVVFGGYLVNEFNVTNYSDKYDELKALAKQLAKNINVNFIDYKDRSKQHVVRHLCPYFLKRIRRRSIRENSDYDYITLDEPIHESEYEVSSYSSKSIENNSIIDHLIENEKRKKSEEAIDFEKSSITELINKANHNKMYAIETYELIDDEIENDMNKVEDENITNIFIDDNIIPNQLSSDTLTYTYSYYKNDQVTDLQSISTNSSGNLTTGTNSSIFKEDDLLDYTFSDVIEYITSKSSSPIDYNLKSLSDINSISTELSIPSPYLPTNESQLKEIKLLTNDMVSSFSDDDHESGTFESEINIDVNKNYKTEKINGQFVKESRETDTFSSGQTLESLTHTLVTTYTYTYEPSISDSDIEECI